MMWQEDAAQIILPQEIANIEPQYPRMAWVGKDQLNIIYLFFNRTNLDQDI